jgi:dihydrofolate reductase (trimethoprim resistance protein)
MKELQQMAGLRIIDIIGHDATEELLNKIMDNWPESHRTFSKGDRVKKKSGSNWHGYIVGWYQTDLTPEGYNVESAFERGSVQLYPAHALELWLESARFQD